MVGKKITKQMRKKIMQRKEEGKEEGKGEGREKITNEKLKLLSDITKKINSNIILEKSPCVNKDSCHYLNGLASQSQLYGIKDIICDTPYGEVFCNEYEPR